jgi:hypothetical protein
VSNCFIQDKEQLTWLKKMPRAYTRGILLTAVLTSLDTHLLIKQTLLDPTHLLFLSAKR